MKIVGFTLVIVACVQACLGQTDTQPTTALPQNQAPQASQTTGTPDQMQAITSVLKARLQARIKATTEGTQHITGKTLYFFHNSEYLKLLESIDTVGSPQEFRLSWLDYVQAWERKLDPIRKRADVEELVGGVVEAVASKGFAVNELGKASTDVGKRTAESDTVDAFRKCVRVALEFGVDASKVTVDQPPNK